MPGWLEQTSGFLLFALVLLDVFLTVLYARLGTGILAPRISQVMSPQAADVRAGPAVR